MTTTEDHGLLPEPAFGDLPPEERGQQAYHRRIANRLRARPGEWALIADRHSSDSASALARSIRLGITQAYKPRGAFDACVRARTQVWAMYVGPPSQETTP